MFPSRSHGVLGFWGDKVDLVVLYDLAGDHISELVVKLSEQVVITLPVHVLSNAPVNCHLSFSIGLELLHEEFPLLKHCLLMQLIVSCFFVPGTE